MVVGDRVELTFLSGKRPLTKQISKTDVIPYPHLKNLTSKVEFVNNIRDFATTIQTYAGNGEALLVGRLTRQIQEASRAGLTDKTALARWVCFDFDGLPGFSPTSVVQEFEKICPGISNTSHIIQYSASSRLFKSTDLRCHLFFMLDEPISSMMLKTWLINANINTRLSNFVTLTPSGVSLHYPLDPALAEQSRLIFISTPVFTPATLDPHPNDRLQYIEGEFSELNVAKMIKSQTGFSQLQKELLDKAKELRKKGGLNQKKFQTAFKDDFCSNPDPCEVTGIKNDRGYVYLNLNNGDSWGYWYPENDPSILYNFKGEPNYPLEKIIPDYWNMYLTSGSHTHHPSGPGTLYFVYQDDHTGKTHSCIYNSHTQQLDISAALSDTAAKRWLASYKQNTKYFHVVTTFYDPRPVATLGVDLRLRTINTYQPGPIKILESIPKQVPKTIDLIIRHALNQPSKKPEESREYEHFLDWLAFIIQARERTGTAWLLHGTQGTGKGVILHNILRPLVGETNCAVINMKTMKERFTDRSDNKLIVGLDEIKREIFSKNPDLMSQLKNIITEEYITSRKFNGAPIEIKSFTNFIFTSNEQVPLEIAADDRRFNVAYGQPRPLTLKFDNDKKKQEQAITITVPNELPAFYTYLMHRPTSRSRVGTAIDNTAKMNMIAAGRTATQAFFDDIRMGNLSRYVEEFNRLQNSESVSITIMENPTLINSETITKFKSLIKSYMHTNFTGSIAISREDMSVLARIMLGKKIPMTPQRYISWLSQFGISEQNVKCLIRKKNIKGVEMECRKQI